MIFFPLFLRLEGRRVLCVGAGPAAEPKILHLIEAGALVHVVSPTATESVVALVRAGQATWDPRPFRPDDLESAWLVLSATGDAAVQREVFDAAEERHVFVLAIDDPSHGSAAMGAVVRRPPFVVAISSSAEVPALTRLVREVIERSLPEARWIETARELRRKWKESARGGAARSQHGSRFVELVRALAAEMDAKR